MIFSLLIISLTLFLLFYSKLSTIILILFILLFNTSYVTIRFKNNRKHTSMLSVDYYAQKSKLNQWNTVTKLIFGLIFMFISILAQNLSVSIFIFICMSGLTLLIGKTKFFYYLRLLNAPILFIALSSITILINLSKYPIGIINIPIFNTFLSVTPNSQLDATAVITRAISAISCLYMISLSTPISKIISVLNKIKMPSVLISLMYLIYRYIFVLLETYSTMQQAASSRLGFNKYLRSIKTTLYISANLFFVSLRKSSDNFSAIESRCFNGNIKFLDQPSEVSRFEIITMSLILVATIILWVIGGRLYG